MRHLMWILSSKAGLLFAASLTLVSCRGLPFPRYERVEDGAEKRRLASALYRPAGSAKGTLRVLLEKDGVECALLLYALIVPPDALLVSALTDLGGTAFTVQRTRRSARSLSTSLFFEAGFLENRLVEDLALAFLPLSPESCSLVRLKGGERALLVRERSRDLLLRRGNDGTLDLLESGEAGLSTAVVRIEAWKRDEDGRPLHPRRLTVEGRSIRYCASIDVIRWDTVHVSREELMRMFETMEEP